MVFGCASYRCVQNTRKPLGHSPCGLLLTQTGRSYLQAAYRNGPDVTGSYVGQDRAFEPFSVGSWKRLLNLAVQYKYLKLKTVLEHQPEDTVAASD